MVEDKIEKTYKSILCNGHNSVWNEDTCNNALNYIKSNIHDFASKEEGENVRIITMNYFMNSSFSNVGQNSYSDPDIEEEYTEIVDQIKDECDEESENYNAENCMVLNEIKDNVVDRADDMDIKESELYLQLPDISLTPDALDCVGILGRPDDNISKPPAFYLQTAFTVMKYVAIVILIVFTIMDYVSAVTAQDDDAIKKATSKLVTRLIICVILFVLPTLIEFLFKILDIYGDVEHCKIN